MQQKGSGRRLFGFAKFLVLVQLPSTRRKLTSTRMSCVPCWLIVRPVVCHGCPSAKQAAFGFHLAMDTLALG